MKTRTSEALRVKKILKENDPTKLVLIPYQEPQGRLMYRLCRRTRNGFGSHANSKYKHLEWVEFIIGDLKKLPILPNPKNI